MCSPNLTSIASNSAISTLSHTSSVGAPKRSRICSVCGDISINYHLNYGASVCLSCRAFFRCKQRAMTKGSDHVSTLTCVRAKFKEDLHFPCEITIKTRRKCGACRMDKCMGVGMKPDAVLDESRKVLRFKNMLVKKNLLVEAPKLRKLRQKGKKWDVNKWMKQENVTSEISVKKSVTESLNIKPDPLLAPPADIAKAKEQQTTDFCKQLADVFFIPGLDDLPMLSPLEMMDLDQTWDLNLDDALEHESDLSDEGVEEREILPEQSAIGSLPSVSSLDEGFFDQETPEYQDIFNEVFGIQPFVAVVGERFNCALQKVNYGKELIQEYASHCFGIPFSKKAFCERHKVIVRKILLLFREQSDFTLMTSDQQEALFKLRALHGAALFIIKLHSFSKALDQLNFCLGSQDKEYFMTNIQQVINPSKLKIISHSKIHSENPLLPQDVMDSCDRLMGGLSDLVKDDLTYQLLTFIAMFSLPENGDFDPVLTSVMPVISMLRKNYEMQLLQSLCQTKGRMQAERVVGKIQTILADVDKIASTLGLIVASYKK